VLTQNYFELFALPQRFALDRETLDARYRALQRSVHPDRYARSSDHERRLSMQRAAQINAAYQALKDPLSRGRYLLDLCGHGAASDNGGQDPEFLEQQMELRERLAEVRHDDNALRALDALAQDIERSYRELEARLGQALDGPDADRGQAAGLIEKMQFFARLREEVQALQADLEDELL
jgi:molecular chaperone HscB